jgi:hypothetical protein
VGIFPKDYTTPAAPVVNDVRAPTVTVSFGTTLQPLTEENETTEAAVDNGAVMAATMTDIQAAIDQLGQHRNDDGRSMSFASTRDDRGSELGHDLDDLEGEDWHSAARRRLFEGLNAVDGRHFTPPVDVEMSDESDADEEFPHLHHKQDARHASSPPKKTHHIKEHPKDTRSVVRTPSPIPTSEHSSPTRRPTTVEDGPKADAPPSAAPELAPAEINLQSPPQLTASPMYKEPSPSEMELTPIQSTTQPTTPIAAPSSIPPMSNSVSAPSIPRPPTLPSATALNSYHTAPTLAQPRPTLPESSSSTIYLFPPKSNLVATAIGSASSTALVPPSTTASTGPSNSPSMKRSAHPSEWTVEQVVEWVRSRGFDEGVCAKFQGSFLGPFHFPSYP